MSALRPMTCLSAIRAGAHAGSRATIIYGRTASPQCNSIDFIAKKLHSRKTDPTGGLAIATAGLH
jgi:hypothetical protein